MILYFLDNAPKAGIEVIGGWGAPKGPAWSHLDFRFVPVTLATSSSLLRSIFAFLSIMFEESQKPFFLPSILPK